MERAQKLKEVQNLEKPKSKDRVEHPAGAKIMDDTSAQQQRELGAFLNHLLHYLKQPLRIKSG